MTVLDSLTGEKRAAIILLSMNDVARKALLAQMSDEEVKTLIASVKTLGVVPAALVNTIREEFETILAPDGGVVGEEAAANALIQESLPQERAIKLHANPQNAFEKLENLNAELLSKQLSQERPQIVAVLLSKLSEEKAVEVLSFFKLDFASKVLTALSTLKPMKAEALKQFNEALDETLIKRIAENDMGAQVKRVASLMELLNPEFSQALLTHIDTTHAPLVANLRQEIMRFESLMDLDDKTLFAVLNAIPHKTLAIALYKTTPTLTEFFLHHLSQNASSLVEEELDLLQDVSEANIFYAQRLLVAKARQIMKEYSYV